MNNARYLIASHCFAFAVTSLNLSLYYVRINLIYERMSLSKLLLKLLLNLLSNDDSQQTLNFIHHLLLNL